MTKKRKPLFAVMQCAAIREKRNKGETHVVWRERCERKTTNASGYCHVHDKGRVEHVLKDVLAELKAKPSP